MVAISVIDKPADGGRRERISELRADRPGGARRPEPLGASAGRSRWRWPTRARTSRSACATPGPAPTLSTRSGRWADGRWPYPWTCATSTRSARRSIRPWPMLRAPRPPRQQRGSRAERPGRVRQRGGLRPDRRRQRQGPVLRQPGCRSADDRAGLGQDHQPELAGRVRGPSDGVGLLHDEGGGRPPHEVPGGRVGSHGITVNAVAPTFIRTPGTDADLADPAFRADVEERIAGSPSDRRADGRRRRGGVPGVSGRLAR